VIVTSAILTDIEGTTSAISFVKDVLFPYADERLDAYVAAHRHDPIVVKALSESVVAHLHAWIREDRKSTPLKTLQGLIWHVGYENGELLGHVYPDVPPVLRAWNDAGIELYVYSSGSIVAQKVLFAHTFAGDLRPLFTDHFDTTTGPKREAASYAEILAATGFHSSEMLFLSDTEEELDAARAAGLLTARLLRPADTPPGATSAHPSYVDFAALSADVAAA
jgi:enolase-phosphatase E1